MKSASKLEKSKQTIYVYIIIQAGNDFPCAGENHLVSWDSRAIKSFECGICAVSSLGSVTRTVNSPTKCIHRTQLNLKSNPYHIIKHYNLWTQFKYHSKLS